MSKHYSQPQRPASPQPPPQQAKKPDGVDSLTVKFDRCDLTGQDHEIQDRSEEGYQFVESFEIDRGSIGMRFIRQKGELK